MDDTVDADESLADGLLVAHIRPNDFSLIGNLGFRFRVNLVDHCIENADLVARRKKLFGHVTTDETTTTGYKNCRHSDLLFPGT